MASIPLCVDLDGALVCTDLLHESVLLLLKRQPWMIFRLPWWILRGKAYMKRRIASAVSLDAATLPYRASVVNWLRQQRSTGTPVYLVTGSDSGLAEAVSQHLGLFDGYWGSDGTVNLAGSAKRDLLVRLFGEKGFNYLGDSRADLVVWPHAGIAILAGATKGVADAARKSSNVAEVSFPRDPGVLASVFRSIRMRHWLKNILVFTVIPASHRIGDLRAWRAALLAFLSLSAFASALYVVNDVLDVGNDRRHPEKKKRPFASGALPLWFAGVIVPVLLGAGLGLSWGLPEDARHMLLLYPLISFLYSFYLKRKTLVDVFVLALLYTFRVLLGGAATGILGSPWLMSFCVFAFLSLALAKRASELGNLRKTAERETAGRGYRVEDLSELHLFGVASAFASSIVLALYIRSDQMLHLYPQPDALWGAVIAICYWQCRIWIAVNRGDLGEDAILFAVRDRISYAVALTVAGSFLVASKGLLRIPGLLP